MRGIFRHRPRFITRKRFIFSKNSDPNVISLIGNINLNSISNNNLSAEKEISGQIINNIQIVMLLSNFINIISSIISNSELTTTTIYKNIILTGQSIINSIVEGLQEIQRNLSGAISTIRKLESTVIKLLV